MSRASRPPSRMRLLAAAGLALPMSQVGHAAAYLERYGTLGLQLEREDVHAYFPQLLQSSAEVLGLLLLAVLVVLAAGRMALGRGLGLRHPLRSGLIGPLLAMAVLQFDVYVVQESLEAMAAHQPYTFVGQHPRLGAGRPAAGRVPGRRRAHLARDRLGSLAAWAAIGVAARPAASAPASAAGRRHATRPGALRRAAA